MENVNNESESDIIVFTDTEKFAIKRFSFSNLIRRAVR